MKLQTNILLSQEQQPIDYTSNVLLLGSCFTENIGEKLAYFKFPILQNPFGITFHPLAIEALINRAVHKTAFTEADVFERDGRWYCFEAHSSCTAVSASELVVLLNNHLERLSAYLLKTSHLFLTLGTAWVYRYVASDTIVANCHKVPQKAFQKELLAVEDISACIERIHLMLQSINPTLQVILTVSPVRHLKDGFVENQRSKAHLLAGIHEFLAQKSRASKLQSKYFPSYEIMLDELRDYRFYAVDMLHPNETAIEYIWEKFKWVWVSSATEALQKEIDTIQKGLQHRPFAPNGASHLKFQQELQQKIAKVKALLPFVEFD